MHYLTRFRLLPSVCALLLCCLLGATGRGESQTFSAGNPNIFYSPWNWHLSAGGISVTTDPGAYFQFTCSGTQSITLNLDLNGVAPLDTSSNYMFMHWTIDGTSYPDIPVTMESQQVPIASGLKPGTHTVRVWLSSSSAYQDRWNALAVLADSSLAPPESLRVSGITLDSGGTLVPTTGLQPHRMVFYGDSITEGYRISPAHNATYAFPFPCARQMHAEFGVIGNSGQGWAANNAPENQIPFFSYAWPYYYQNTPRFSLASPANSVDYIVVNIGTNDPFGPGGPLVSQRSWATKSAVDSLTGIRSYNPTSKIFLVVPFGGYYEPEMQNAMAQYKQTHPQDHNTYLVDLGWSAWPGLNAANGIGPATAQSFDGVHPNIATSQALGFQLAAALQTTLGQYDFLGAGRSNLILQNNTTGQIAFQSPLDATLSAKSLVTSLPQSGYQVAGAADFNGDGKPDLVLQNRTTGALVVWYMNGTLLVGSGAVTTKAPIGWQVVSVTDLDSDGKPDLVLQNSTTGQVLLWYMNGLALNTAVFLSEIPPVGSQVVGMADFNRDGKPDLVLQNPASTQVVVWSLDGIKVIGRSVIPLSVPAGYKVESVADYFGDGRADLVLRNSAGALLIWRPAETSCLVGTFATPRLDSAWHSVGPH